MFSANQGEHNLSVYKVDEASGGLIEVPGSPFATEWFPYAVVVDPTGHFAYVANNGAGNIGAYKIDPATGALAQLPGSPYKSGLGPYSLSVVSVSDAE